MELPLELGSYIQSFLKPTQPLFDTLKYRYPLKWKRMCASHCRKLFKNYYNNYHVYKEGETVILQTYLYDIRIKHIKVTRKQLKKMKMSNAMNKKYEDICHELQVSFNIQYCV